MSFDSGPRCVCGWPVANAYAASCAACERHAECIDAVERRMVKAAERAESKARAICGQETLKALAVEVRHAHGELARCGAPGCVGQLLRCSVPGCPVFHPNACSKTEMDWYCKYHHAEPRPGTCGKVYGNNWTCRNPLPCKLHPQEEKGERLGGSLSLVISLRETLDKADKESRDLPELWRAKPTDSLLDRVARWIMAGQSFLSEKLSAEAERNNLRRELDLLQNRATYDNGEWDKLVEELLPAWGGWDRPPWDAVRGFVKALKEELGKRTREIDERVKQLDELVIERDEADSCRRKAEEMVGMLRLMRQDDKLQREKLASSSDIASALTMGPLHHREDCDCGCIDNTAIIELVMKRDQHIAELKQLRADLEPAYNARVFERDREHDRADRAERRKAELERELATKVAPDVQTADQIAKVLIAAAEQDGARLLSERNAAARADGQGRWVWSDTDPNDIESMGAEMVLSMTAKQLRALLSAKRDQQVEAALPECVREWRGWVPSFRERIIAMLKMMPIENAAGACLEWLATAPAASVARIGLCSNMVGLVKAWQQDSSNKDRTATVMLDDLEHAEVYDVDELVPLLEATIWNKIPEQWQKLVCP